MSVVALGMESITGDLGGAITMETQSILRLIRRGFWPVLMAFCHVCINILWICSATRMLVWHSWSLSGSFSSPILKVFILEMKEPELIVALRTFDMWKWTHSHVHMASRGSISVSLSSSGVRYVGGGLSLCVWGPREQCQWASLVQTIIRMLSTFRRILKSDVKIRCTMINWY